VPYQQRTIEEVTVEQYWDIPLVASSYRSPVHFHCVLSGCTVKHFSHASNFRDFRE